MGTGRTCDGYESIFRTGKPRIVPPARNITLDHTAAPSFLPTFFRMTCQDIEVLSRYFSTKTLWGIKICYEAEARQVLQASVKDSAVRHAVLSLGSLRETLETSGSVSFTIESTPKFHYGVQQYSVALGSLAHNLSNPSNSTVRSALLCCQVFISIELVRNDHAAAMQHFTRGLRIMHEYRARAGFDENGTFIQRGSAHIPFLDIFVIKMYAAPCMFTEQLLQASNVKALSFEPSDTDHQRSDESSKLPKLAPDSRTLLARMARSVADFLDKVFRVNLQDEANALVSEKIALLEDLEEWEAGFRSFRGPTCSENRDLSDAFTLLFYQILKVVLTTTLDASTEVSSKLQAEFNCLGESATMVSERAQKYSSYCQKGNIAHRENRRVEGEMALQY